MPINIYPYELPPLPYAYEALEPYIDIETMRVHHDGHFKTYINNLNQAMAPYSFLQRLPLERILRSPQILFAVPAAARTAILRNGGGVFNHNFFFNHLTPARFNNLPTGRVLENINRTFGAYEQFKQQFKREALSVFGSGWTFLTANARGQLRIVNVANQDTPLAMGLTPLIVMDVWEHAYYLKYQNRRAEYIDALWNVLNWEG